jgi:hypothetical protein
MSDVEVGSATPATSNVEVSRDDILANLVGEGKKFKSVEDLAKGKVESDTFINKLQDENRALRALINNQDERKKNEELMEEILARVSQSTLQREQPVNNQTQEQPRNQSEQLTSREVENIFHLLREREKEEGNLTKAFSRIADKYGDKSEEFLNSKARELGLDVTMLKETARRSPSAFWNLVGENNNNLAVTRSPKANVNSAAIIQTTSSSRNKAYYDKLKNEMGTRKFILDSKVQVQMHRDMMELGDAWDA